MMFTIVPIGFVRSPRDNVTADGWGDIDAIIELAQGIPAESLDGMEAVSHVTRPAWARELTAEYWHAPPAHSTSERDDDEH